MAYVQTEVAEMTAPHRMALVCVRFEDAGITDVTIRYGGGVLGGELLVSCRKPAAS